MFDNNKQLVLDLDTYMNLYAKACHFWVILEEAWQQYYRLKCSCCRIFIQIAFYCVDTVCVLSLLTFFESRQMAFLNTSMAIYNAFKSIPFSTASSSDW